MAKANNIDVHAMITDQIIEAIEKGADNFEMPWNQVAAIPKNEKTGNHYKGINILILSIMARLRGYEYLTYATYKQWKELGAQVKKGETATQIVKYKTIEKKNKDNGEMEVVAVKAFYHNVFNVEQVEGYEMPQMVKASTVENHAAFDQFAVDTGINIKVTGDRAFYTSQDDTVYMPNKELFIDTSERNATENYYSVLAHEMTHATGHKTRLDRQLGNRFGSEAYAQEELIAELGATFLCAEFGIAAEARQDHASYIASWLKLLRNDKKAIFQAASEAQKAVEWLLEAAEGEELTKAA